jgi:hypothetical protein
MPEKKVLKSPHKSLNFLANLIQKAKKNSREIQCFIVILLIGILTRILLTNKSDFPLNDGGMFYSMSKDLIASNFSLPKTTTYNLSDIPFAYPPLGFYITALLNKVLQIPLLELFRILPLTYTILLIPIFYLLSKEITKNKSYALAATLVFTLLPRSVEWLLMGGGITRSLGYVFCLLSILFTLTFFKRRSNLRLLLVSVFLGLTLLSHLEMFIYAAYSIIIFYFFFDTTKKGALLILSLLISSPWWISVISDHGLNPFIAAFQSKSTNPIYYFQYLFLNFTNELLLQIFTFFGILGLIKKLIQGKWFYIIWIAGIIFLAPRGSANFIIVPLALLAPIGIFEVLLPGLKIPDWIFKNMRSYSLLIASVAVYGLLSFTLLFFYENSSLYGVSKSDRQAMHWVEKNTQPNEIFIVITPQYNNWSVDKAAEWFPALSKRKSINTLQGKEWLSNNEFASRESMNESIQDCILEGISCIEKYATEGKTRYDFIYISYDNTNKKFAELFPLQMSLMQSSKYNIVYKSKEAEVWQRKF